MIRYVDSFHALATTPFADGVNALCWTRTLPGDFAEVVARLGPGEGIVGLDEDVLQALPVSAAGRAAIACLLADLRLLRDHGLGPELNCIHGYPRDEEAGALPTDVYSFHADRAPIAAETWLCTYHGAPSEGVRNTEAQRRIDIPAYRAELLRRFAETGESDPATSGGEASPSSEDLSITTIPAAGALIDATAFAAYLEETCHDLHYHLLPHAQPYSFGIGHLWRIAVAYPESPVPPCIHRAPNTGVGDPPRLLLIS